MPPAVASHEENEINNTEGVSCVCWPRRRRRKRQYSKKPRRSGLEAPAATATTATAEEEFSSIPHLTSSVLPIAARRNLVRVSSVYHDADDGRGLIASSEDVFLDASQGTSEQFSAYPIVTTSTIPKRKSVSLSQPESLLLTSDVDEAHHRAQCLRESHNKLPPLPEVKHGAHSRTIPEPVATESTEDCVEESPAGMDDTDSTPIRMRRHRSVHNTRSMSQRLANPSVPVAERGFPGSLQPVELEACLKLASELEKEENAKLADHVYCYAQTEEKPYALCRFLRNHQFNVDSTLKKLREQSPAWQEAQAADFYPEISRDCLWHNAPVPAFLDLYPYLAIGTARNGCPVTYFHAGKTRADGVFCLADVESAKRFFWNQSLWAFPERHYEAQQQHPEMVRMESITVLDLDGLSSSSLNAEARQIIQASNDVGEFFPETMHCMVIINAPGAFVMFWKMASRFLDARMAQRIQVYRSGERGMNRLRELIDPSQLPADYQGDQPSIADSIAASKGGNRTYVSELMFLKRRGQGRVELDIPAGKRLESLDVYTRSISSARVVAAGQEMVARGGINSESGCHIDPNRINILDSTRSVDGPTSISVEAADLDDVGRCKCSETHARGHLVVVGTLTTS